MIKAEDFTDTFNDDMYEKEIKLRGKFLNVSADLEFIITETICLCYIDKSKYRKDFKAVMLGAVNFGRKLEILKMAVNDFNSELYEKNKKTFVVLEKHLVNTRNLLAHSYIQYDPEKKNSELFICHNIKKGKIRADKIYYTEMLQTLSGLDYHIMKMADLALSIAKEKGDNLPAYIQSIFVPKS